MKLEICEMKIYPILFLMSFCFPVCLLYGGLQCPFTSERRFRAKWLCQKHGFKEKNYACLYDAIMNAYQEKCNFKANILDPGEQYIINHRPTSVKCENANRYQPFGLQHFSDQCVYRRSICSESGQIRFNDGSVTTDKSCRCNVAQGYAFITSPVKRCYCTPSTEDCSCFLKKCAENFTLSLDYQCIHMSNKSYQSYCPGIDNQESSHIHHTTIYKEDIQKKSLEDSENTTRKPAILILVCIFIMVAISSLLLLDKMPSLCYVQISPISPNQLNTSFVNGVPTLTWTFPKQDLFKVTLLKIRYTLNGKKNEIDVDSSSVAYEIPNIRPMQTYRFQIASCVDEHIGQFSEEHVFSLGRPFPPNQLNTYIANGILKLTWTIPEQYLFKVTSYKIHYTANGEENDIDIDASSLECDIPNIRPMQTYRFQIASCVDEHIGQFSKEHMFSSGTPIPPNQLNTSIENYLLALTWTSPKQDLFKTTSYKIRYTQNGEENDINVEASSLSYKIPNILPMQTYRFQIASCVDKHIGPFSEEYMFLSGTPIPPNQIQTVIGNCLLGLRWTFPRQDLFKITSYKIRYTQNGEENDIDVDASRLYAKIPNIRPMQTYRFQIASCVNKHIGQFSKEHMFSSGRPPQSLTFTNCWGNKRSIRLVWTAPSEVLFETYSYELEISTDNWTTMTKCSLLATELEYEIPDFTVDAMYRFKLYTVCHSVRSLPTESICCASSRYQVEIELEDFQYSDVFRDETSQRYLDLREKVINGCIAILSKWTSYIKVTELTFCKGSLYAVLYFHSKTSYDEGTLRYAFKNAADTGKFGKLHVSNYRFIFKALDNAVPPQSVRVKTANTVIDIFWEKPAEPFFRIAHYLLKFKTDEEKIFKEIEIPSLHYQYRMSDVLPSTKYTFKMLTIAENNSRSIPSSEVYIVTEGDTRSSIRRSGDASKKRPGEAVKKRPDEAVKMKPVEAVNKIREVFKNDSVKLPNEIQ